jgi:hypothetical protein
MLYRFADSLRAGSGWNCSSILILLVSCCFFIRGINTSRILTPYNIGGEYKSEMFTDKTKFGFKVR